MDSQIKVSSGGQLTINAAGLLLLFGWACYTLLTWLAYRYLPGATTTAGVIIGGGYLLAVGGLLAFMATQALKFGQHVTYRRAIGRTTSPIGFWFLTLGMGGVGTALLGAGAYALGRAILFR